MVEQVLHIDYIFQSLADPTRRDILRRIAKEDLSVGEIARHYELTFAAISKHLKFMEKARLISKRRRGKEQIVSMVPQTIAEADRYIEQYRKLWDHRFNRLETLLKEDQI